MAKYVVRAGKLILFLLMMVAVARLIDPSQYISSTWVLILTGWLYGEENFYAEYTDNVAFFLEVISVLLPTAILYLSTLRVMTACLPRQK